MKTNDFVKAVLPVAADIVKDIIKDSIGNNDNHHHSSIEVDKEKSGMDIYRGTDRINVNVNLYVNVYVGLGERTKSLSGVNYADQY